MPARGPIRRALPAVAAALTLGAIGVLGMAAGIPWLFPSLGPTIAIQAGSPELPAARPWNVFAGHLIGLACGLAAVYVTGAVNTDAVAEAHQLSPLRIAAAATAVLLSMLIQQAARSRHPPAEATTLLIALGAMPPTLRTAATVAAGVVLVTVLGEATRRLAAGDAA